MRMADFPLNLFLVIALSLTSFSFPQAQTESEQTETFSEELSPEERHKYEEIRKANREKAEKEREEQRKIEREEKEQAKTPEERKKDEDRAYYNSLVERDVNGKRGLYTKEGKELIPPIYDHIRARPDLVVEVREGHFWGLLDMNNEWIIPKENYTLQRRTSRHYSISPEGAEGGGVVDVEGQVILENKYSKIHFNKKAKFIYAQLSRGIQYGIYDFDGHLVAEHKYAKLKQSTTGYTYATNAEGKVALINMEGKEISEFKFDDILIDEKEGDWIFEGLTGDYHTGVRETIHRTKKIDYRKRKKK